MSHRASPLHFPPNCRYNIHVLLHIIYNVFINILRNDTDDVLSYIIFKVI